MIKATFDHYDLYPSFSWEEVDLMAAKRLRPETEILLKEKIYNLQSEMLSLTQSGTPEELDAARQLRSFMLGQCAAYKQQLDDSKEAHLAASLNG